MRHSHVSLNLSGGENEASGEIGCFAVVPYYDLADETVIPWWNSSQAGTFPVDDMPGQIWIAIANYPNNEMQMQFINCELYIASLSFRAIFANNVGSITNVEKQWLNPVNPSYLLQEDPELSLVLVSNSYSAFTIYVLT
jgi:hypothetical protein